jgi:hypothetical protein
MRPPPAVPKNAQNRVEVSIAPAQRWLPGGDAGEFRGELAGVHEGSAPRVPDAAEVGG